jgi:hypothetical protein
MLVQDERPAAPTYQLIPVEHYLQELDWVLTLEYFSAMVLEKLTVWTHVRALGEQQFAITVQ